MVHGGSLAICESFLKEARKDEKEEAQRKKLAELMIQFIKLCGFAIALNRRLVKGRGRESKKMK